MLNSTECVALIYKSYLRVQPLPGYDAQTRDTSGVQKLFSRLNLKTDALPTISVTGSKGKGSTSLLCAAMLQGLGYRVGLVTSPHLVDFRERIRLNGYSIPEADFVRIMNELAPAILEVDDQLAAKKYLGPNGLVMACAVRFFSEQGVNAMVLEAGRGGRFDDIGLFHNAVTCLTPIMAEHLDKLGPTVPDVAWNKAGLIKPSSVVVSVPQTEEVAKIIQKEATLQRARLLEVGTDVQYNSSTSSPSARQEVEVAVPEYKAKITFSLQTPGLYQAQNTALAAAAVLALANPAEAQFANMAQWVNNLRFPGRCEVVSRQPAVIVDGAINRATAAQFLESAAPLSKGPVVLVTALPEDKDYGGLLAELTPHCVQVIITEATNPNLHFTPYVVAAAQKLGLPVLDLPDPPVAFEAGLKRVGPDGTLWVVGTQSLVRDALRFWGQTLESVWIEK